MKPDNIIKVGDTYKINDFSFSMLLKSDPQKVEQIIYTSGYRAPEVKQNIVSLRSDVWAFGKMMQIIFSMKEQKKLNLGDCLKLNYQERTSFVDIKKIKFVTDTELYENNKDLPFKNNRHQNIFCQKLRNTGKSMSCSLEYKNIESYMVCNKFNIKI